MDPRKLFDSSQEESDSDDDMITSGLLDKPLLPRTFQLQERQELLRYYATLTATHRQREKPVRRNAGQKIRRQPGRKKKGKSVKI